MMQIYCLVDPRNNCPFYVGATKVLLTTRLSGHINEAMHFIPNKFVLQYSHKKHYLIKELIDSDLRPRIDLLYISPLFAVEYYESFFHDMLKMQGFKLFNSTGHFNYLKYTKVPYYQYSKK